MISPEAQILRREIFALLGGRCACACGCGDTDWQVFQTDHRDGNGNKERRSVRGDRGYLKLKNELLKLQREGHDPSQHPTCQALCANCHFIKTQYGPCHRGSRRASAGSEPTAATGGDPTTHDPRHRPQVTSLARIDGKSYEGQRGDSHQNEEVIYAAEPIDDDRDMQLAHRQRPEYNFTPERSAMLLWWRR